MNLIKVDIILPCYNPEEKWADNVIEHFRSIQEAAQGWIPNLIVVNDGSARGIHTEDIEKIKASIKDAKWISYEVNRGKGYALRKGVEQSRAEYIVLTDIDFPYTTDSLVTMVDSIIRGEGDVLAGERKTTYYEHTPLLRKYISKLLKTILKGFLRLPVTDTQCGLKVMNRAVAPLFLRTTIDRYLFDVEFLWMAAKEFRVCPYVVTLRSGIVFSKMNGSVLMTEGWNFIRLFFRTIVGK